MPKKVIGFGFERADFVEAGAVPVFSRLEGVQEADLSYDMDTVEVEGDDDIIAYWHHNQKGEISIKAAVIDLDVYAAITGNTVVSEAGPPAYDEILFGTDTELQPVEFMLRLKQRAKDPGNSSGRDRYVFIFRCIGKIKPVGMKKGEAAVVDITANMLKSATGEYGDALSEPAFGKQKIIEQ
ncbi:MAG: hypothetical protein SWK76_17000 [Actinomycetota bacterium]|nr:hypothetical protein [Actinomycetota bacterium]